jgi:cytochrome c
MKMEFVVSAVAAGVFLMAAGSVKADEGSDLSLKYKCQTCHTVDRKLVGPSFKDIAKKYAADKGAADKLAASIKNGSKGVWGPIAMPKNDIPDADVKKLVVWILSLK